MTGKLIYAGVALDRVAVARRDDSWIAERLADPEARIVPVWRDFNLIAANAGAGGAPGAVLIAAAEAAAVLAAAAEVPIFPGSTRRPPGGSPTAANSATCAKSAP